VVPTHARQNPAAFAVAGDHLRFIIRNKKEKPNVINEVEAFCSFTWGQRFLAAVMAGGMLMPGHSGASGRRRARTRPVQIRRVQMGFGAHALEGHLAPTGNAARDCQTGAKGPSFRSLEKTYAAGRAVGVNTTGNPGLRAGSTLPTEFGVWSFQGNSMYRSVSRTPSSCFDLHTPIPPAPVFPPWDAAHNRADPDAGIRGDSRV